MSVVLNGSSQYLYTNTAPVTAPAFTVACFVKPDSAAANGVAASVENGEPGTLYRCHSVEASGASTGDPIRAYSFNGIDFAIATTTTGYSTGSWQHLCGVFAASNSRSVYLNGGGKNTNTTSMSITGIDRFLAGVRRVSSFTGYFDGKIAELAVWNVALSDADVLSLAGGALPSTIQPDHLIAYWPLESNANDAVGANNLTASGSPSFDSVDHPIMAADYVDLAATGGGSGGATASLGVADALALAATGGGSGSGSGSLTLLDSNTLFLTATGGGSGSGSGSITISCWPTSESVRTRMWVVAVGNDQLWYEGGIDMSAGEFVKLAASEGEIDTSDQVVVFEAYGKVFVVNGAKLKVADFVNTKITTLNVGANPPDRGNILTDGTSNAQMVVDYITTVSGACTIYGKRTTTETFGAGNTITGTDDDGNAISFVLDADEVTPNPPTVPPHWYNWTVYGGDTTNYGTLPAKAYLGALSGGRCVLSGNPSYPHQCPASAAGNPWDWNIYRTTADRAVPIGTGASGTIGDVVRALIPARDGQLIIGCANSIHILIGNPADGGQVVDINGIGVYGSHSWCLDADGNLYFWGTGGVNRLAKGSAQIGNISQMVLPDLVDDMGADPSTHRITMEYDPERTGIKVCITLLADGSSHDYWLDLKMSDPEGGYAFFPDSHANAHGVYSQFYYNANDPSYKGLLCGCTDGYLRVHDDATANDDGTAIDSYVCFGPISLAEDGRAGAIAGLDITLAGGASGGAASDSNNVTVKVYADDVAETVVEQLAANGAPKIAATFTGPGRKPGGRCRRGVRGAYAGIRIGNGAVDQTWGFEHVLIDGGATGRKIR